MKIFGNSDFYLCIETIDNKNVQLELDNQFVNNVNWYNMSIGYSWSYTTSSNGRCYYTDYNTVPQPYFNKGSVYKSCNGWLNGFGQSLSVDSEEVKKNFIKLEIEVDDEMRKIDEKLMVLDIPFTISPTKCIYDEENKKIMEIIYTCFVYVPIYSCGLHSKYFQATDLKMAMKMVWKHMRTFSKTCAILSSCIRGEYYNNVKTLNLYKIKEKLPF